ncbi:MAG: PKD domain-containing protein [Sphingobacteriales bacterium]|nr:MAG: PKD domain-containing protein [Sphingobacteriales bacterium]
MRTFYLRLVQAFCSLLLLFGTLNAQAQCPTLTGQPDTFYACKFTRPWLPTDTIRNILPGTQVLDTLWTPSNDLTHPDSLTTAVFLTDTGRRLRLSLRSLRPNINIDSNFDGGTFQSDYIDGGPGPNATVLSGYYSVTNNPTNGSAGFASFPDHTGNPNGKMLVANGASVLGLPRPAVYRKTFPVAPGIAAYRIRVYATPVTQPNPAAIQFRINGVLQGPAPLPLPATTLPFWREIEVDYNVPTGVTSMNIEIVDNESSILGNDFALDDLTIQPLCIQRDSTYVRVFNLRPLLEQALGSPRFGCERDTFDFRADTTQPATGVFTAKADVPDRYFWDFGDGTTSTQQNPRHFYTRQDTFRVKLFVYKDGFNKGQTITCVDSAVRAIDNRRPFYAGYIQDKDTICRGDIVNFQDTSKPATLLVKYYFGTGDSSTLKNIAYTYDTAGRFQVFQVVTDAFGCTDTARSTVISVGPVPLSFTLTDTVICEGETIRAQALIDSSYQNYNWDFGDGRMVSDSLTVAHTYVNSGTYNILFTATHPICPAVNASRPVEVVATPQVNLGQDTFICPTGQPILLQNLIQTNDPATVYQWSTGDKVPSILARHDGTFFLKALNKEGCSSTDTLTITRNCFLSIPSSFTPDGDGVNDYFLPRQYLAGGLMTFKMRIYNRWGQQIYETERTDGRGWDGKLNGVDQPVGVYLYFIEAGLQNGMMERYDGNVTLLR